MNDINRFISDIRKMSMNETRRRDPYIDAEYHFINNRDESLWVKCLAYSDQDYNKAKSRYIKTVAQHFFREEEKLNYEKLEREREVEQQRLEEELIREKLQESANASAGKMFWLTIYPLGFYFL